MARIRHSRRGKLSFQIGASVLVLVAGLAVAFTASGSASTTATTGTTGTTAATTATTQKSPPAMTSPPTVSGTPQEGKTLTGNRGNWSNSPTDYNYFWTRCDKNGGSCADISGAHGAMYKLTSADVGNTLRFKVQASNSGGSTFSSSVPTAVIQPASVPAPHAPQPTSPPNVFGTPQEGKTLTGSRGTWSNSPTDYNYFWTRCGKNGGSCSAIAGAHAATYTLTSADVGNTLRFKVQASNSGGSNFASSVPTAVIQPATAPPLPPAPKPANGCPAGPGPAPVAAVSLPARLVIDQFSGSPNLITRSTQQVTVRIHVSDTCGQAVQGAYVSAAAIPFNQLSNEPPLPTDAQGWVTINFQMLPGFPVSPRQQLLVIFLHAQKPGDPPLAGIQTSRLTSLHVRLR